MLDTTLSGCGGALGFGEPQERSSFLLNHHDGLLRLKGVLKWNNVTCQLLKGNLISHYAWEDQVWTHAVDDDADALLMLHPRKKTEA